MDALRARDAHADLPVPHPRTAAPTDDETQVLERLVASIADLILKASALADRYDRQLPAVLARADADERIRRLRAAAARGQRRLQELLSAL